MPTPSLLIVPARFKSGKLYSQIPTSGAGDFTVTRATTATRVNASGLIESVASGIPRLDYFASGGTVGCPALLVEPSAKNFWLQSENLTSASWAKLMAGAGIAPTVSASTESLFGLPTFEVTFTPNGTLSGDTSTIRQGFTPDATGNHTQSWYIRSLSGTQQLQAFFAGTSYQLTITETPTRITATSNLNLITTWNSGLTQIGTHTRTNGKFLITAAQVEAGSVATSYIPTTTAAVTRNADVVSVSGAVSGSIGQLSGTIYAEVDVSNWVNLGRIFSISDGTSNNRIMTLFNTSNRFRVIIDVSGSATAQADISSASLSNGIHKIAIGYAANDVVFYVDGVLVGSDNTANIPACSQVFLGKIETSASTNFINDRIRAAALYTTRLTNAELATLTTP
jgi:hypothetical protein